MEQNQANPEQRPPVGFYVFMAMVAGISLLVAGYLVVSYFM